MKKWLLSIFVIFTFASYVIYQRTNQTDTVSPENPTKQSIVLRSEKGDDRDDGEKDDDEDEDDDDDDGRNAVARVTKSIQQKTPVADPAPTGVTQSTPPNTSSPAKTTGQYKDGSYTGKVITTIYGDVQMRAVIKNGKLATIETLQAPHGADTSIEIANMALPVLKSEAITVQSAQVDAVSGATQTSKGFKGSLADALAQAKL
ncbi:MAG: FMN-binding protein [Candidatus Gracilibacteria bacterium]